MLSLLLLLPIPFIFDFFGNSDADEVIDGTDGDDTLNGGNGDDIL